MSLLRSTVVGVCGILGAAFLFLGLWAREMRSDHISSERNIHSRLIDTIELLEKVKRESGHLPTQEEFRDLVDHTPIPRGDLSVDSSGPYLFTGIGVQRKCGSAAFYTTAEYAVAMYDEDVYDCYTNDKRSHALVSTPSASMTDLGAYLMAGGVMLLVLSLSAAIPLKP